MRAIGPAYTCTTNHTVVIPQPAASNFTIAPGPHCEKTPVSFLDASSGTIKKREWDFGDLSGSSVINPTREYNLGASSSSPLTVSLTTTDILGCADTKSIPLSLNAHRFYNHPDFHIDPDLPPPFCEGSDSVQLGVMVPSVTPAITLNSYLWSTGATSSTIWSKTTGTFFVDVTDTDGCRNIAGLGSTGAIPSPGARIIGEREYCEGEVVTLNGFRGDVYTYTWKRDGMVVGNQALLKDKINTFGVYEYVIEISDNFCTDTDTALITIHDLPTVQVSPTSACASAMPILTATPLTGVPPFIYKWGNGDHTATTQATLGGMYAVRLTDSNNCSISGHATIHPRADFKNLMTGCYKFCQDSLNIRIQGMGPSYGHLWLDEDGPVNVSPTNKVLRLTSNSPFKNTVWLEATKHGCTSTSETITYEIIEDCSSIQCRKASPNAMSPHEESSALDHAHEVEEADFNVSLIPNPTTNHLSITYNFETEENNRIIILNGYQNPVRKF